MKSYIITAPPAKALIHLGKRLWFFVFRGKRKGEGTYVLKEGKEAFLSGFFNSYNEGLRLYEKKREEGKGDVDHHTKGSKEEEGREGGKEGSPSMSILDASKGIREGGEGKEDAIFVVREDGKSWVYENIVMEHDGASSYIVYIRGTQEGWEEFDTITCHVPHQQALFALFNYLLQGRKPLFGSLAEFRPIE